MPIAMCSRYGDTKQLVAVIKKMISDGEFRE